MPAFPPNSTLSAFGHKSLADFVMAFVRLGLRKSIPLYFTIQEKRSYVRAVATASLGSIKKED
jgi:hypothetical protein